MKFGQNLRKITYFNIKVLELERKRFVNGRELYKKFKIAYMGKSFDAFILPYRKLSQSH